ncbi:MAG: methyltransferase [Alphaproteobacteria bacterium]|nr:methyltransferase [Alphaproteobacteria bacterium]
MADRETRDRQVRAQYEGYPYPERRPEDERTRLITGSPSGLAELNHYVFGGRRDLSKPLRALVAGGGTGDAMIMLAQHMADADVPGEVVHLDLSGPSQEIARRRAEIRGLDNIRFVTGSLLDAAEIAPGPWDYIDCCGVLHHLEDPDAGLAALAGVLAPDGGMGLMVYGEYGRIGVYHMQDMLRMVAPGGAMPDDERIALAKRLADALPGTAWLNRNGSIRDHTGGGDPGVYDLFLHARDRAYTVPQVYDWVAGAGLRLVSFIEPYRYDPAWLTNDPRIGRQLDGLAPAERSAFAELFAGNLKKHIFYAVRDENPVAPPDPEDRSAIPVPVNLTAEEMGTILPPGGQVTVTAEGLRLQMSVPPLARAIGALCDGERSIADIHAAIRDKRPELDEAAFAKQFAPLYRVLNAINKLVLRVPAG